MVIQSNEIKRSQIMPWNWVAFCTCCSGWSPFLPTHRIQSPLASRSHSFFRRASRNPPWLVCLAIWLSCCQTTELLRAAVWCCRRHLLAPAKSWAESRLTASWRHWSRGRQDWTRTTERPVHSEYRANRRHKAWASTRVWWEERILAWEFECRPRGTGDTLKRAKKSLNPRQPPWKTRKAEASRKARWSKSSSACGSRAGSRQSAAVDWWKFSCWSTLVSSRTSFRPSPTAVRLLAVTRVRSTWCCARTTGT